MKTTAYAVGVQPVAVKRIGSGVWILRLTGSLRASATSAVRDAFGRAIEQDATDIVVDLSRAATVSSEGAAQLVTLASVMRDREGSLWIAAAWPDEAGVTLRPIHEPEPAGLLGISAALDRALGGMDGESDPCALDLPGEPATA